MYYEEKIMNNILFQNQASLEIDFNIINLNRLIKICSSHLMLPTLYVKISKNNDLKKGFPKEFINYLKHIYLENKKRNEVLTDEIKHLSCLLKKNKINHVFLKGSAMISSGL